LAGVFNNFLPAGYYVTQPQVLRDTSPLQLPGLTETADRYVIVAVAYNPSTQASRIYISSTKYDLASVYDQCVLWFDVNDSPDTRLWADSLKVGTSGNALVFTANILSYSDNSFQYAKLWMLPKAAVYNDPSLGSCPRPTVPPSLVLNMPNADGSLPVSVIPTQNADGSPTAYLVNSLWNGGSSLTVWKLIRRTPPSSLASTNGCPQTLIPRLPKRCKPAPARWLIFGGARASSMRLTNRVADSGP
jgi:hypothetical protein